MTPSTTSTPGSESEGVAIVGSGVGLGGLADRLGPTMPPELLAAALVHRSWCAENPGHESNERLEFLGDAVLSLVVTDHLYRSNATLGEGGLTDIRKGVVNQIALAEAAARVGIGDHLLLGRGEELSGGRTKPSILADAVEAVIGAAYLYGGLEAARCLVLRLLEDRLAAGPDEGRDHKSRLQELTVQRFGALPRYDVEAAGPDHARTFRVTVSVDGRRWGEGEGRSKKQAEQSAARTAVEALASPPARRGAPDRRAEDGHG